jgi:hypothetical protein
MKNCFTTAAKNTLLLATLIAFCIPAMAIPITGGFGTTSAGVMTYQNAAGARFIDFCPPAATSPPTGTLSCSFGGPLPGEGLLLVQGGTGTFSSIVAPEGGRILDLSDQPGFAPFTYFPVGVPVSIDNFIRLNTFPLFNFRATEFAAQTCAPSLTTVCAGGFILTQVANNVSVSFTVNGVIIAPGFEDTPFTDVISGTFTNTTILAVALAAQTPNGIFSNTWSGQVTANPIPEPATYTMFGIAAAAIMIGRFRRGTSSPE